MKRRWMFLFALALPLTPTVMVDQVDASMPVTNDGAFCREVRLRGGGGHGLVCR